MRQGQKGSEQSEGQVRWVGSSSLQLQTRDKYQQEHGRYPPDCQVRCTLAVLFALDWLVN